ncbi:hypothetical protein GCM10027430_06670 [Lysobacter tyrosinilyticus]
MKGVLRKAAEKAQRARWMLRDRLRADAAEIRKQVRCWNENGFAIFRGYFDADQVARLQAERDRCWLDPDMGRIMVDITSGELRDHRIAIRDCPAHVRDAHHRLNDVYLESASFRHTLLSGGLASFLRQAFDGHPLIVNSLHFNFGSENEPHVDTFVLPPAIEGKMAGMTIVLEDYSMDNGALFYYPKSHLIPQYLFSHGSVRSIEREKPRYLDYILAEIERRGIRRAHFLGKPGDVFFWHAHTVHGGLPIAAPDATRQSIVSHFWREGDIWRTDEYAWLRGLEQPAAEGFYLARPHQEPMSAGGIL